MDAEGWQTESWKRAKANIPFEIHGALTPQDSFFFEAICAAYGYKFSQSESGTVFTPLDPE